MPIAASTAIARAIDGQAHRDAGHGEAGGARRSFLISGFVVAGHRHFYCRDDLVRLEHAHQQAEKKIVALDPALAAGTEYSDLGIEGDDSCRPIAGRIGMGDAAADGAAVAHLDVGDGGRGLRQ